MFRDLRRRAALKQAIIALAGVLCAAAAAPAQTTGLGAAIELIDPEVLRVCADPHSLPFSNEAGEGYEQRLAELLAQKLGKSVAYTYFPEVTGFVRNTLAAYKCDVIISYPQGDELVQNTNAYYQTAYALVFQQSSGLEGVQSLADPRLKGKRIGIVAGTPPATNLAINGLMGSAKPYHLMVDTRRGTSAEAMIRDLEAGEIDAALLWGPIGGYYAKNAKTPMAVVPLLHEKGGSRLVYRITMGVRPADQQWKRQLNELIAANQPEINKILLDYGVPLLDEQNNRINQ
ncbi:MAG: quinoprotein dehydrogenase-associated putative ABC transporter substrate-binding protein [Rhizobiales bacterium]|nr:quinoprotein dehydrogenase-associated putative ABC transporter substrate-binding protein [Hyphomicrobiales bacterium]